MLLLSMQYLCGRLTPALGVADRVHVPPPPPAILLILGHTHDPNLSMCSFCWDCREGGRD